MKCTLEVQWAGLADRFGEVPEGGIGNRFLARAVGWMGGAVCWDGGE